MPKESRQSGAKATNSFNKKFHKTLLKLTVEYAAIIFVILFLSASVTYSLFSRQLNRRFANFPPPNQIQAVATINADGTADIAAIIPPQPTATNVSADLVETLLYVNSLLFILSVSLSYLLARLTLRPIRESYDNQCRFLGDASHELRTPLAILYTNLENELADKTIDKEQKAFAKSNLEETKRMNKIIGDLLTLSRMDEGAQVELNDFDASALIEEIINRLAVLAKSLQVVLHYARPASPIMIKSNRGLLDRALTNFVKNAILYNKSGGSVNLTLEHRGKEAAISIKDTGVGMTEDNLSKVFDRFFRVDKSRSRQTGGSGLGLSIAKESVEKLGGKIKIQSEANVGTTIEINLPHK